MTEAVGFLDLETDGLLDEVTTIWCGVLKDATTGEVTLYDPDNVPVSKLAEDVGRYDTLVIHNGIAFDGPVLEKLFPGIEVPEILDTLVLSRLLYGDIKATDFNLFKKNILPGHLIGSHSLAAWGHRLSRFKGDYHDWSCWTPEMSAYCKQDVEVLHSLYCHLISNLSPGWERSLRLETEVAKIIGKQERTGFCFDLKAAEELHVTLLEKREELLSNLRSLFPPQYKPIGKEFTPKKRNVSKGYFPGAPFTKVELFEFNPSSRRMTADALKKKYGWAPSKFTESTGEPVVDEEVLGSLPYPEAKVIAEYLTVDKRIGQLAGGTKAWLKYYNPKTGRIHGSVNPCGAVTGRMTHSSPNIAQVPAGYSPYGKECRSLFKAKDGYKLVGCDASGLELRCLAHYLAKHDGGEYGRIVVYGSKAEGTDAHTVNMRALGISSRDDAKTWIYAYL